MTTPTVTVKAKQRYPQHPSEVVTYIADFGPLLKSGETLSNSPAIPTATDASGVLTISNVEINDSAVTDAAGKVTAENEGVQFQVSGAAVASDGDDVEYIVTVLAWHTGADRRAIECVIIGTKAQAGE